MARDTSPSYVVTLELDVSREDEQRLLGTFEAAKRLHNTVLQEGIEIVEVLRADPAWAKARAMPRKTAEQRDARYHAYQAVRAQYGFTKSDFQRRATAHKNAAGFADRLGAHVTQRIAERVFAALERWVYGTGGRPRFKGRKRPLHSIESKNNATALSWDFERGTLSLGKGWYIAPKPLRMNADEWLWSALQARAKCCRVLWRQAGDRRRWFVQLVMQGNEPLKASVLERLARPGERGALDVGPSHYAWVTETDAGVEKFCPEVDAPKAHERRLERQIDRQRRANNPDNYDAHGRIRRGKKTGNISRNQRKTEAKLRTSQTRTANRRKNAHGRDTNHLMSLATEWRDDGVSNPSLQKNYGRSVLARAPGRFMSELARKAERAGGERVIVDVRTLKTSQFDHSTNTYAKKKLSERWHAFGDGRGRAQRDVYSAFLALHAVCTVDAEGEIRWAHDCARLEAAWQRLAPALVAKGLFVATQGEKPVEERSIESGTRERASIPYMRGVCEPESCEATTAAMQQVPGRQTRGAARAERTRRPV